ncbi:MAG TPA: glycosyltransferase family 2 protein [Puia sp.]|nr:glycosyltransferase family 2 protein [Puia sp.]
MSSTPLVSVLMTSYNREKYISEAIESVLESSYRNFELIVVDDCSKDKTVEIARGYAARDNRVKVHVNEKNLGDYPNRNRAASYARGKYIKYLDADDLIYYYGLSVMVNYMEQFPAAGFGLASMVSNEAPFPICIGPAKIYQEHFFGYGHFSRAPGSSIIRLDCFNKVAGFSGARMIGDFELWCKLGRYYDMVKFPFDLYWNRVHDGQESKTEYAKQYPALTEKALTEALNHPECPLTADQLDEIKRVLKKQRIKGTLLKALSRVNKIATVGR